ncbi:MAG: 3-hydroxyacyl-ACP dehydratase FabZ [Cystobacterineae bacterium]|nr:3-hydroxyacyl-ACP dehydratase FabZ [Cystobacterineae bacterium]
MDIREIQQLLPHRYPFLLVDRVETFEPGKRLVAFKNVTFNEPFFGGHFPNHPVMPGVLILEALAQACAILAYKTAELSPEENVSYLMAIDQAKFRRPVVPGDKLLLTVTTLRRKGAVWKHKGEATVDGHLAAEAEFMATLRRKEAGDSL